MIVSKCVIVPPLKWEVNFERALSDSSSVSDTATWEVKENTEP